MAGKFIKVKCECKNEQIIFSKSASIVKCVVCGNELAKPTGGEAIVKAKVIQVME